MSSSLNNTPIFREYIGVKPVPKLDDFPAEIVSNVKEFHFILGIGTENYIDGKGTGVFKITWDDKIFSKERVREIKKKFSNVKVILSFGGLGNQNAFNPSENTVWTTSAFDSIKKIIQSYQITETPVTINTIDGIDINYEYITVTPNGPEAFTSCTGKLITKLKTENDLSLNTFSISPSKLVETHYYSLYKKYPNEITWINYQFYLHPVSSKDDFVKLYKELLKKYPQSKLLPGGSTDPKYAGNLKREDFIEGITELINDKPPLAGAFVWNANDSSVPANPGEKPFYLEIIIQQILTGGGVTA